MKAVADTLAVARSNLIERVSRRAKSRRPYRKAGDNELLALIRRLVDERPTYGYRRYPAPHKPVAKARRKAASQWQACAADHAGQQTDARTAYRPPARAHA